MNHPWIFFSAIAWRRNLYQTIAVALLCIALPKCLPSTLSAQSSTQSRSITGRITDTRHRPIVGATIRLKGTLRGTVSNPDGSFRLDNVPAQAAFLIRAIGYTQRELPLDEHVSVHTIVLQDDIKRFDDIIITGFAEESKRNMTGNSATVTNKAIRDIPITTVDQALQGLAAGVVVSSQSGKLGQTVNIRIRGNTSVSANSEPLYVVDGIPINTRTGTFDAPGGGNNTSPLQEINPQDIESIDILKDASASAVFGSRAANGVILITTKRGKAGRSALNVAITEGWSMPTRTVDMMSSGEYIGFMQQAGRNADRVQGLNPSLPNSNSRFVESQLNDMSFGTYNSAQRAETDWQNAVLRVAHYRQVDASVSSGTEQTLLFLSGQHFTHEAISIGNALRRISGRINVEHNALPWLRLGANIMLAQTINQRLAGDESMENPLQAVALPPITPLTDPTTGLPVGTPTGRIDLPLQFNPLINQGNSSRELRVLRSIGTLFADLMFSEDFRFRTEFGFDVLQQGYTTYFGTAMQRSTGAPLGIGQYYTENWSTINTNAFFTYQHQWEQKHRLLAVAGLSVQEGRNNDSYVAGRDFPADAFRSLRAAANIIGGQTGAGDYGFLSYFARANYSFNNTLLVALSGRVDGSSRFGADQRYGFFPAASLGYVLSEDFFPNSEAIQLLKIRASYGRTGNAGISNFLSRALFYGGVGYNGQPGQALTQLGNRNLTWETTDQANVGVDFSVFGGRLSGSIDVYNKETDGLLMWIRLPFTSGFGAIFRNFGAIRNRGIEILLHGDMVRPEETRGLGLTSSLNVAYNHNVVTNYNQQELGAGFGDVNRIVEGYSLGAFFAPEYAGVDTRTGDAQWYKNTLQADGSRDRTITKNHEEAEFIYQGNAIPSWTFGWNTTLSYQNLSLNVHVTGRWGNLVNVWAFGRANSSNGETMMNQTRDQLQAWRTDNTATDIPEARLGMTNGSQMSSRYLADGSFVRLRAMTLAYTLPSEWLSSFSVVKNVRVSCSVLNLLTITKYRGWDPEVNADDYAWNASLSNDLYTIPQPRTMTFGVSVEF